MDLRATPNLIHLSESGRRSVQLPTAKGFRIVALSGDLWVTQAGFSEDYILRPGDELTLESYGPAVVTSFGPADIEVVAPPQETAPVESPPAITDAVIERARSEAHRLRAQAMQEAFAAAAAWVGNLGRRAVAAAESIAVAGDAHRNL
jgi:hypothetical protein